MSNQKTTSEGSLTFIRLFRSLVVLIFIGWLSFWVYQNATNPDAEKPFKLGLDLAGGSHLVYEADVSELESTEIADRMDVLRDVIERRVNIFGVSEPIVRVESSSFVTDEPIQRLVVELPGVTDINEAVAEIGRTPTLEFKLFDPEKAAQLESLRNLESLATSSKNLQIGEVKVNGEVVKDDIPFTSTGLTGYYLETATMEFAGGNTGRLSNEPLVSVRFNEEGATLFAEITKNNVNRQLGIFLDGELISAPNINEPILGGAAVISGNFTLEEAKSLAQNLSYGALPVPIELQSTQTIGASLGAEVLDKGIQAGVLGLSLVMMFMILWYRLPGFVAGLALLSYMTIMLALFQIIPVTLTAAGLAGFILSLGMAVDANVLVFERMKEEFQNGSGSREAASVGFSRAWSAIRDGNITSLLSAIILFWFGTSMVKGFALVFGVGVIVSMLTALVVTRTFLLSIPETKKSSGGFLALLLGSGLKK